jgi:hypothetical protein
MVIGLFLHEKPWQVQNRLRNEPNPVANITKGLSEFNAKRAVPQII